MGQPLSWYVDSFFGSAYFGVEPRASCFLEDGHSSRPRGKATQGSIRMRCGIERHCKVR